jgi:hypothetical protein
MRKLCRLLNTSLEKAVSPRKVWKSSKRCQVLGHYYLVHTAAKLCTVVGAGHARSYGVTVIYLMTVSQRLRQQCKRCLCLQAEPALL